jgi:hypothetical protein
MPAAREYTRPAHEGYFQLPVPTRTPDTPQSIGQGGRKVCTAAMKHRPALFPAAVHALAPAAVVLAILTLGGCLLTLGGPLVRKVEPGPAPWWDNLASALVAFPPGAAQGGRMIILHSRTKKALHCSQSKGSSIFGMGSSSASSKYVRLIRTWYRFVRPAPYLSAMRSR